MTWHQLEPGHQQVHGIGLVSMEYYPCGRANSFFPGPSPNFLGFSGHLGNWNGSRNWITFIMISDLDNYILHYGKFEISSDWKCWEWPITHLPLDKMAAISQTTVSIAFSWIKILEFLFNFHWKLFLRVWLTINQHWFRLWLGTEQVTSHYLNQCWPCSPMHICSTRGRWVGKHDFTGIFNSN